MGNKIKSKSNDTINGYKKIRKIGQGSYGEVYQVMKKNQEGKQINYAMKIINREIYQQKDISHIVREAALMKKVNSQYIVQIYDCFYDKNQFDSYFYIVMEICGNSLDKMIKNLNFESKRKISLQIIQGVAQLHRNNIIHRDIKLENILWENQCIKISDFGISKQISNQYIKSIQGTTTYMSYQLLAGIQYSFNVDAWAVGLVLMEIWSEKRIYESYWGMSIASRDNFPTQAQMDQIKDAQMRNIVRRFLKRYNRSSVVQIAQQLKKQSIVSKGIQMNPTDKQQLQKNPKQMDNTRFPSNIYVNQQFDQFQIERNKQVLQDNLFKYLHQQSITYMDY